MTDALLATTIGTCTSSDTCCTAGYMCLASGLCDTPPDNNPAPIPCSNAGSKKAPYPLFLRNLIDHISPQRGLRLQKPDD